MNIDAPPSTEHAIKDDNPNALVYLSNLFFLLSSCKCPIKLIREYVDAQINVGYLLSELLAVFYLLIIYLPIRVKESVITNSDGP
jgi:hypothetical protein